MKKILPILIIAIFIVALVVLFKSTTAQSSELVMSDFAKDVQEGELATANDSQAQQDQREVQENEVADVEVEGQDDNLQTTVDPSEAQENADLINQEENQPESSTEPPPPPDESSQDDNNAPAETGPTKGESQ